MDCISVNMENVGPTFLQTYLSLYQNVIYIAGTLICYVAVMLQMKDSCSALFRTNN